MKPASPEGITEAELSQFFRWPTSLANHWVNTQVVTGVEPNRKASDLWLGAKPTWKPNTGQTWDLPVEVLEAGRRIQVCGGGGGQLLVLVDSRKPPETTPDASASAANLGCR